MNATETDCTLVKRQRHKYGPKVFREGATMYRIRAHVRHDDECGNGHNTFSITAEIERKAGNGRWVEDAGGCLHDEVARHFSELAPFIKWHLCSTDGPMHYPGNAVYHAGARDCHGLLEGERRQLRRGRTGPLCWVLQSTAPDLPKYVDSDEPPTETATLRYVPWESVGEGKARELDTARSCAIWPEATDEELMADDLRKRLLERLPALMADFRAAVESLGFTY